MIKIKYDFKGVTGSFKGINFFGLILTTKKELEKMEIYIDTLIINLTNGGKKKRK